MQTAIPKYNDWKTSQKDNLHNILVAKMWRIEHCDEIKEKATKVLVMRNFNKLDMHLKWSSRSNSEGILVKLNHKLIQRSLGMIFEIKIVENFSFAPR